MHYFIHHITLWRKKQLCAKGCKLFGLFCPKTVEVTRQKWYTEKVMLTLEEVHKMKEVLDV